MSFLERVIRATDNADTRPVFAEVGLISSHAPWTPILPVLDDWDSIGDGSVFAPWENAGEHPDELWRDMDRVRDDNFLTGLARQDEHGFLLGCGSVLSCNRH